MAAVATHERLGGTNATYGTLAATGMPPAVVNEVCPFDAKSVSLLWRGVVAEMPYDWRARRTRRKQANELVAAARLLNNYLPAVQLQLLTLHVNDNGVAIDVLDIMDQWLQVSQMKPWVWRQLTEPMINLLGVAHLLANEPRVVAVFPNVDETGDAPLLDEFNATLPRFLAALESLVP